jgi:hypothetical protein
MLFVVGTIPDESFPLVVSSVSLDGDMLTVDGRRVGVNRGTPALLAAAAQSAKTLGVAAPLAFLVGDEGLGRGSRKLYHYLTERVAEHVRQDELAVFAFHYLQPDVDWHNKVLFALQGLTPQPMLIADAGFMYAAKMSGQAPEYALFTPDVGELAFLADEKAPHPFYTRGFILQDERKTPELIRRAYMHDNAARWLLVKGKSDYVADRGGVKVEISGPSSPAMEAIGGTGDTLTGIVATLAAAGFDMERASLLAARTNRIAGSLANPTPATQVAQIIARIPQALEEALRQENGS